MTKQTELQVLVEMLRQDQKAINANPLVPATVKNAVETTLKILEILISEF